LVVATFFPKKVHKPGDLDERVRGLSQRGREYSLFSHRRVGAGNR
jgi:hypothetical protein